MPPATAPTPSVTQTHTYTPHLEVHVLVVHLAAQARDGALQCAVALGLAAARRADEHDAEAHVHGVVQLEHLGHKRVRALQAALVQDGVDGLLQVAMVLRGGKGSEV